MLCEHLRLSDIIGHSLIFVTVTSGQERARAFPRCTSKTKMNLSSSLYYICTNWLMLYSGFCSSIKIVLKFTESGEKYEYKKRGKHVSSNRATEY